MKVITKREFNLEIEGEEFEILFAWNKKRGVDKDYWFTPTGKCKVYIGALSTIFVGHVTEAKYSELVKLLKKNKIEYFKDGRDFFTTTSVYSISEIVNMTSILYQARKEWEDRKYIEYWVEDNRPTRINKFGEIELID